MKLHPFHDVVKQAEAVMERGGKVYQQFNCAGCGVKQTMDDVNVFHTMGHCEECGHITDIKKDGCNFLVIFGKT